MKNFTFVSFLTKLIYLDVSSNRLIEDQLPNLTPCRLLLYLDASSNMVFTIPPISNALLYEMNLSNNMIGYGFHSLFVFLFLESTLAFSTQSPPK